MMGEICGSLSGSLMAIGLAMGQYGGQNLEDREGFYRSLAAGFILEQREKDWADAQAENVYPYVFPKSV